MINKINLLFVLLIFSKNISAQLKSEEISAIVENSVVLINTYNENGDWCEQGSGVVISDDGIIVTNYHVYDCDGMGKTMKVYHKGRCYNFDKELKRNIKRDYLVFSIKNCDLPAIKFGDSNKIKKGEKVYAMGSPISFENVFSEGTASGIIQDESQDFILHTAPITPGSSGGALVINNGNLVGINVSQKPHYEKIPIDTTGSFWINEAQNLNYAIPFSEIWNEIKNIKGIGPILSELPATTVKPSNSDEQYNNTKSINKDCEERNTGEYCFTNNTNVRLRVTISAFGTQQLTLEPGQTQCFFNLRVYSWNYNYIDAQVGAFSANSSKNGEGKILVEKCKSKTLTIR